MPSSPRSYRQRHSNTNLRFINRVRVEGRLHSIDDEVIVVATINSIYSTLTFKGRIVEIYEILNKYFVNVRVFSNISLLTAKRLHLHFDTIIVLAENFNE